MTAYGSWISEGLNDAITSGVIKAMLVDDSYTPDPDATTPPTASEVAGTGYTAGGVTVTSLVTISYDSSLNRITLALTASVDFGTITVAGIGGVCFYVVGGKPLVVDMFGSTDADGSDDFLYTASPSGVLVLQL